MSIRVFLIDSQELVRSGLRAILEMQSDLEVAGEANDCIAAVERLSSNHVDVILLSAAASGPSTAENARTLAQAASQRPLRLLVLVTELGDYVVDVLKAGASGFLLKTASPEELTAAVRIVAAGYSVLTGSIATNLFGGLPTPTGSCKSRVSQLSQLSPRELDVLRLIAQGCSNAEIAEQLHVSQTTVKSHVQRLLKKLVIRDRIHAVIFSYEVGLVRPLE